MLEVMPTRARRTVASRFAATATALVLLCSLGVVVVPAAGATTPRAKSPTVSIKNFAFSPKTLTVKAGSKVTVNYPYHFMVLNGVARLVVSNTTLGSDFTMAASATMRNEN